LAVQKSQLALADQQAALTTLSLLASIMPNNEQIDN
jgi:hypothetical protein